MPILVSDTFYDFARDQGTYQCNLSVNNLFLYSYDKMYLYLFRYQRFLAYSNTLKLISF